MTKRFFSLLLVVLLLLGSCNQVFARTRSRFVGRVPVRVEGSLANGQTLSLTIGVSVGVR